MLVLVGLSVIAVLLFVSVASAQCADYGCGGSTTIMETTMVNGTPFPKYLVGPRKIPPSGGPAIVLPATALLLGSGILTYAVLRRR